MADPEAPLSKTALLGMVAMAVAVFVVANDFTALSVAIPAIEKTFGTSVNTAQWVINGYAMVFGVPSSPAAGSPTCSAADASSYRRGDLRRFLRDRRLLRRTSGCCSPAASSWASAAR